MGAAKKTDRPMSISEMAEILRAEKASVSVAEDVYAIGDVYVCRFGDETLGVGRTMESAVAQALRDRAERQLFSVVKSWAEEFPVCEALTTDAASGERFECSEYAAPQKWCLPCRTRAALARAKGEG